LSTPWALTVWDDRVYVVDSGNSRVQVIEKPSGTRVLRELASNEKPANGGAR
jgi:DNA-binding beta-propeller fold protein YncE